MLRPVQALLGIAVLAGCSPPDAGAGRWLTQPTNEQHTSLFFPISTGRIHAMGAPAVHVAGVIECNSCHGTSDSFQGFDCLTCHAPTPTIPNHVQKNVGGFSYDSPSCYGCHPDGIGTGAVDHTRKFPIAPGQIHATGAPAIHVAGTIQCTSCHANIADRAKVDCTICHNAADQNARHAGLIGPEPNNGAPLWSGTGSLPAGETANCLLCHSNGALQRVATHGQSPTLPGGFLIARGGHFQSCEQCHTSRTTDPARRNPQIDFAALPRPCTSCHLEPTTSANHLGTSWPGYPGSYSYNDAACRSCHPNGDIGPFDHSKNFPTTATDVHNSSVAGCTDCHTNRATPTDIATINCIGCHNNGASSVDPGGINSRHTTPAAGASLIGFGYTFDSSTSAATVATNGLCLKCHAGTIATPSWTNVLKLPLTQHSSLCFAVTSGNHRVNQTTGGAPACFTCHNTMNTITKPWGVNWTQVQCTACHTNRPAPTCR